MQIPKIALALALALCSAVSVYATEPISATMPDITGAKPYSVTPSSNTVAIGPILNTAGVGIEARMPITEGWFARAAVRGISMSYSASDASSASYNGVAFQTSLGFKATLRLLTIPVMVDYHPIDDSGFRVSAGVAYNGNKISAKAGPQSDIILFGNRYTAAEVGNVSATLKVGNPIAPIISIGYDNSLTDDGRFSFNAELGVMYAGKPKLTVSSSGLANQVLHRDLVRESNKGLKKIEKYLKWYPVLGIGFKINL